MSQMKVSVGMTYHQSDMIRSPGLILGGIHKKHIFFIQSSYYFDQPNPNQIMNTEDSDLNGVHLIGAGYGYGFDIYGFRVSPQLHVFGNMGLNYRKVDFYQSGQYFIYRKEVGLKVSIPVSLMIQFKRFQSLIIYNYGMRRARFGLSYVLFKRK